MHLYLGIKYVYNFFLFFFLLFLYKCLIVLILYGRSIYVRVRAQVYNIVIYISVVFVAHVIDLQRSRVRR